MFEFFICLYLPVQTAEKSSVFIKRLNFFQTLLKNQINHENAKIFLKVFCIMRFYGNYGMLQDETFREFRLILQNSLQWKPHRCRNIALISWKAPFEVTFSASLEQRSSMCVVALCSDLPYITSCQNVSDRGSVISSYITDHRPVVSPISFSPLVPFTSLNQHCGVSGGCNSWL